jgi:hypothetical protein
MGAKTVCPSLREQHVLQVIENKVLWKVFKPSLKLPSMFA